MKKGFTLVELLAVIVILAIILAIAVPSITNIVDNVKLNSYKNSEKLMADAAKNYLSFNSTSFNEGETKTITYLELRDSGFISKIIDYTTKAECTKSKIFVTLTGGDYTYKPGIICDSYISLDTFDLLNGIGNFETLSGWTAYNGPSITTEKVILGNYSIKIVKNGNNRVEKSNISVNINDKIYAKIDGMLTSYSSGATEGLFLYDTGNIGSADATFNTSNLNSWQRLSTIHTASTNSIGIIFGGYNFNNPEMTYYGDDLIILDLTSMYGSSYEPTKTQMDSIIAASR